MATMKTFKDIIARLERMVKMLEAEKEVVVEEFKVRPPLSPEEMEKVVARARGENIEVPEDVLDFYSVCNGFVLRWNLKKLEDELEVVGTADVLPMEDVFSDWEGDLYFSDEPELNERDGYDLTRAKVFDAFIEEAGILLYFGDSSEKDYEMLYHYYGEGVKPLGWSLKEYLNNLIRMRALWYWQSDLIEAEGNVLEAFDWNDIAPEIYGAGLADLVKDILMREV